jgi:hypothetical protein
VFWSDIQATLAEIRVPGLPRRCQHVSKD